jgi:phosphoribosylformylglycinamidine synthase I
MERRAGVNMNSSSHTPRALVLRAPGINCDRETAHACRVAGFATDLLHINFLIKHPERLLDYQLLVIPGGFSYGDDLGAGTLLAKNLTVHLGPQLQQFIDEKRLVLGICNGFQVLVRAGLLPGHVNDTPCAATLTDNESAQFECRWVPLHVEISMCLFTQMINHPIELPVAHGEGQFVLAQPAQLAELQKRGQVPLTYAMREGTATAGQGQALPLPSMGGAVRYPYNPNGSIGNIAGICNDQGNVLGLMPHPERYVSFLQHPQRKGATNGEGAGLLLFKNAYQYARTMNRDIRIHVGAQCIAPDDAPNVAPRNNKIFGRNTLRPYMDTDASDLSSASYASSGVNINAADRAKALMKEVVQASQGPQVLAGMGAFAGMFDAGSIQKMHKPALVSSTDGAGTKTLLAAQAGRFETIGADLVNHSVNDLLTQGATPLFFMDYLAMGKLDAEQAATIVCGVADACREVGCALLGGETAEMPDVYLPGAFDLAGTIVGVVEQDQIINGTAMGAGDILLGLPSNGLHTNGYSLARRVFAPYIDEEAVFEELGEPLIDVLLRPHRCYLREIQRLQAVGIEIRGMAHITGGGFEGNISRILPERMQAVIETGMWTVPPVFTLIERIGQVSRAEMYRTFNMGVGMVLVVSQVAATQAQQVLPELFSIGHVTNGNGVVLRL